MFGDFLFKRISWLKIQHIWIFILVMHIFLQKGPVFVQLALVPDRPLAMIWATDDRLLWNHIKSHGCNKWTTKGCYGRCSDTRPERWRSTYWTVFNYPIFISSVITSTHDDIITWKHFRVTVLLCGEFTGSLVNYPHKGQWRGALMFFIICAWTNGWVNNRDAGYMRRHRANNDVTEMVVNLCSKSPSVENSYLAIEHSYHDAYCWPGLLTKMV